MASILGRLPAFCLAGVVLLALLAGCASFQSRPLEEIAPLLKERREFQAGLKSLKGIGLISLTVAGRSARAAGVVLGQRGGRLRVDLLEPSGQTGFSLAVDGGWARVLLPLETALYAGPMIEAGGLLPAGLSPEDIVVLLAGGLPGLEEARPVHLGLEEASRRWRVVLEGERSLVVWIEQDSRLLVAAEVFDHKNGPENTGMKITYSDHRNVSEVTAPFSVRVVTTEGDEMAVEYSSLEFNLDLPPAVFRPPTPPGFSRRPLSEALEWMSPN